MFFNVETCMWWLFQTTYVMTTLFCRLASQVGGPTMAVIADNCPNIKVAIRFHQFHSCVAILRVGHASGSSLTVGAISIH
jgi:hypothetical protein